MTKPNFQIVDIATLTKVSGGKHKDKTKGNDVQNQLNGFQSMKHIRV